jgi:hypothetical protein
LVARAEIPVSSESARNKQLNHFPGFLPRDLAIAQGFLQNTVQMLTPTMNGPTIPVFFKEHMHDSNRLIWIFRRKSIEGLNHKCTELTGNGKIWKPLSLQIKNGSI